MFRLNTNERASELRRARNARYRDGVKQRTRKARELGQDELLKFIVETPPTSIARLLCNLVDERNDALTVYAHLKLEATKHELELLKPSALSADERALHDAVILECDKHKGKLAP